MAAPSYWNNSKLDALFSDSKLRDSNEDIVEIAEECKEGLENQEPSFYHSKPPQPAIKIEVKSEQQRASEIFDPVFGIRVTTPARVCAQSWGSLCHGCTKIRLSTIRPNYPPPVPSTSRTDGSWLTMGVLVKNTGVLHSSNSSEYVIWRVSDLAVSLLAMCRDWHLTNSNSRTHRTWHLRCSSSQRLQRSIGS